ncbi:hypothetical protein CDAR_215921 [Caerostris darwini]|uniref:Uncharacterized protein n=1 Tax=Caerostris darwini TaxID=1538125 RepID=A0AAV4NM26_9ARAC|nr:hypothetical protein CDAR_215921 [Caerostris darwini]
MADPLLFPSSLPNIRRRDATDFEAPPCRLKIPAFPVTRSGSPPPPSNGHFRTSRCPQTLSPSLKFKESIVRTLSTVDHFKERLIIHIRLVCE